ncbi:MAG: glycogen synthase GlgA [Oscillibacter sp.]|jgi:starch synthase|nr:glycogen synthase GlgA [Oscillibacter sp.]
MKILYATSEATPFCKTGGLADVAGSLPPALAAAGAETAVILPLYQKVKEKFGGEMEFVCFDYVDLAWRHAYCGLFRMERAGVTWYFLDNEQYFLRPDLYGYMDDGERFGFFSRAVVRMLPHLSFWPEVIHCNDWQTALIPIYLKDDGVRDDRYRRIRTVLSVHNIEYQGRYGLETLGDLFGLDHGWADDGTILMDGDVNLLKGAILCADAVNAVSPTYAEELKYAYYAHGMESIMRRCSYKLSGVLNGIDTVRYDPETDPLLVAHYHAGNVSNKAQNKAQLQKLLGLQEVPDVPIIGIVSRLVTHKGLDLICEVLHDMMELPVQVAVLGKGDYKYEEFFRWATRQYPGRLSARLDYSEELATMIYSGADLFLMPSRSEPCGLSQMIAMRYGTVPIVRETGGLKDTVHPYEAWRDSGNGFTFASYHSGDMLYVIRQAVSLYRDNPEAFRRLQERGMEADFSWNRSAKQYLAIYASITGEKAQIPEEQPARTETQLPAPNAEPVQPEKAPEKPAEMQTPPKTPAKKPAATKQKKKGTAGKKTPRKTAKPSDKKKA